MKKLIVLILILAAGAGIYFHFMKPAPDMSRRFMTYEVKRGDIISGVEATGTLEGSKQVSVGAQVSGQLQKLYVDTGDEVKAGMLLAQIDSRTQENSLKDAEAALNTYRAQLVAAKAELKRAQILIVQRRNWNRQRHRFQLWSSRSNRPPSRWIQQKSMWAIPRFQLRLTVW